jgi:Cu(I)/Ag(I) efflux system membrane fusion protein
MKKAVKISIWLSIISILGFGSFYLWQKYEPKTSTEHIHGAYSCPMHPEIKSDKPGICSICGMHLIKSKDQFSESDLELLIQPTDKFIVGNYKTASPIDTAMSVEISLPGILAYDPNTAVNIAARAGGRLEKIYVKYKFQSISKGQKLFEIYSPELLTEQQNFLYLIKNDANNISLIKAAKKKLILYGMTEKQVYNLEKALEVNPTITIFSPVSGIIQESDGTKMNKGKEMSPRANITQAIGLKEGSYIQKNQTVFTLLNTQKVWGLFNVLQGFNTLIHKNMPIRIQTEDKDIQAFMAKINFVETQLNSNERTNSIRVHLDNTRYHLPIGTRLRGFIQTEKVNGVFISRQSTISLGEKQVVFVKSKNGFFAKEIQTANEMNGYVQVTSGLSKTDEIAENAQYLTDSESFIKL